jgi:hypothetical protein
LGVQKYSLTAFSPKIFQPVFNIISTDFQAKIKNRGSSKNI